MYIKKIIETLNVLKQNHPKVSIGNHIATALDDRDLWSITDKELHSALTDYQTHNEAFNVSDDNFDVDEIIKDGLSIGK